MAAVLAHAPAEDRQQVTLYEQPGVHEPQHEREGSVGANARTPGGGTGTPNATAGSTGKGGRPKSSVWKHFHTEGKRDDKSKREDVRCRYCSIVMPGRAEGMEKHIASDCQNVDEAAKQEMSQLLMTKKLQNLEKRGLKRRAEAAVEGAGTPSLLEGAANAYAALPDPHHRSYGALLHAAEAAHNNEPQHVLQHAAQDGAVQAAPALGPPPPQAPLDMMGALQQLLHGQQEIQAKLDNVPRRLRNSRAATGESLLRPLCRERFGPGGQPGVLPPVGLFPGTWREALRADAYRLDMLIEFYGDNFGITGHDSLEDKQSKFLEWIGAVRP